LHVQAGLVGDPVDITANATAQSITISFGLAGAGVVPNALTEALVEAFVGSPAALATAAPIAAVLPITNDVRISPYSAVVAHATADGTSASGLTVTVLLPTADASGTTRAYVGQAVTVDAAAVDIDADSSMSATAHSTATDFGIVTATVVRADAFVSGIV